MLITFIQVLLGADTTRILAVLAAFGTCTFFVALADIRGWDK